MSESIITEQDEDGEWVIADSDDEAMLDDLVRQLPEAPARFSMSARERSLFFKMSPAEIAAWNEKKQRMIYERKQAILNELREMPNSKNGHESNGASCH